LLLLLLWPALLLFLLPLPLLNGWRIENDAGFRKGVSHSGVIGVNLSENLQIYI
jgi:hypothetical protein